ncbi:peptidase M3 [Vitiosangium sp. GDMCC 1.1324]|uniref:peptidase M3 n=1 Tax=Vitiosangium sp. (strain GDMCC 1.1324) TaxID=2138576 RepID=UPI000D389B42|nr:peptidase M3 [Vitiosangium sp. GDMCC 1.1324]PTL79035.1 peptidase M3 [Vitiosangium sp. GDMCC 1.1324]
MDRPLPTLRANLDDFLADLATLHYRHAAGLAQALPLRELYEDSPEISSPEAFAAATETVPKAQAKGDSLGVRRLRLLRDFIATQVEEALAAPEAEAVARLEASARLPVDDRLLSFGEALGQLPHEPNRGRRALLESAAGGFLWDNRGRYGARRDAAFRVAEQLRAPSYVALREDVSGIELSKLAEAAEQTLRRTEDAYRDVLGYVLKKVDPLLRPLPSGNARRHDLQAATQVPWMSTFFRREDGLPAVVRWLGEWGFHPSAEGRIRLDDEERPGKASRPFTAAVRIPDEVRLVFQRRAGMDALGSLLHEYGHALHHAHVSEQLPLELRRLGDASVTEAFATLFERLLTQEEWLKRYLRLPSATARDASRMAAFQGLTVLRRHSAKLAYELSLYAHGASPQRAEEYTEAQRRALFVEAHPGFFLFDVDPQLYVARYLRAWALESRLTEHLTGRFNEDWWRNPTAGRWLQGLFARGGTDDAEALATEISGKGLTLPEAGDRLVALLDR